MRAKARSEAFALKQQAHQEAREAAAAAAEEWGGLGTAAGTAAGKEAAKKVKQAYQPAEKLLTQYYGKINVEKYDGPVKTQLQRTTMNLLENTDGVCTGPLVTDPEGRRTPTSVLLVS